MNSRGHAEARRLYPLDQCEWDGCDAQARDHHHRDGDATNNAPENIARLCRRHHMESDGRLSRFREEVGRHECSDAKPCANCARIYKPLRRGRCAPCAKWFRIHGSERPYAADGRSGQPLLAREHHERKARLEAEERRRDLADPERQRMLKAEQERIEREKAIRDANLTPEEKAKRLRRFDLAAKRHPVVQAVAGKIGETA